ncbi:MAG TPA: hypothetical protein VFW89_08440 [Gemmatimonadaceae bacterium]|nr:hypothetical protein [Gemmatimonadaceae bacterium]
MPLTLRLTGLAAAAVLSVPGAGIAQAGSAPADAQPIVSPAIAARLTPGKRVYVTRLMSDGAPQPLGLRTIEVRAATYHGTDAWSIVDTRQLQAATLAETLYVARSDLTPLHRAAHFPGQDIDATFASDSIRTTFAGDSGTKVVAIRNERGIVASLYLLQFLVGLNQVHVGWHGSARLPAVSPGEGGVVSVNLSTIGEETVRAPDGDFPCWVVAVDIGKGRQRLWVRKTDGVVVKERVPVIGMEATEVENLLAQHGVQP